MIINEQIIGEITALAERYKTIPIQKVANKLCINMTAKQSFSLVIKHLFKNELSEATQKILEENCYDIKTIVLEKYGSLKESISLPMFKYCDIIKEQWETSTLRNYLYNRVFIFVVFRYNTSRDCRIETICPWTMSTAILDKDIKQMWTKTVDCIRLGHIVKYIDNNGRRHTFFPAASESPYMHVRPHARNSDDTIPLPVPDALTGVTVYPKHSFWLNKGFIAKIVSRD